MNFCLKRQHCFVCAVLLFISLFFVVLFWIFNYIPDFFCHPFLHTNRRPNCGHGARVYSCFAPTEKVWMVFSAEIRVAELWKQHKCPVFNALHTQTLPAHDSKVLLPGVGCFSKTDLYSPALHLPVWSRAWDVASVWGLARSINVFHNQCESEFAICSWFAH